MPSPGRSDTNSNERPYTGVGQKSALGELMYESHASYGACGLGSGGTDLLVKLVRESGLATGLYGAKITGGGSGGVVAVLARGWLVSNPSLSAKRTTSSQCRAQRSPYRGDDR